MSESIGLWPAWCALSESGAIEAEDLIPADEDGLARLALRLGPEVRACVEMMSGAIWVKDQLELAGWEMQVCSWHMLSRGQVFQPNRSTTAAESSRRFLTDRRSRMELRLSGSSQERSAP